MKSRNYYSMLWLLLSAFFLFASCEKDDLLEPLYEEESEEFVFENSTKCRYDKGIRAKTYLITKKTWTFGEVFHEDPAIQETLESVFTDLKFDFRRNGTYHIVIPVIGRDDTGTWEFIDDGEKVLFDKGTEGEHFINVISLKFRKFKYTYDDPALGPWELHLVPHFRRWHR